MSMPTRPEQDALRLRDELVAWADQNVRLRQAEQAEGHGGDTLHASESQDLVCTTEISGVHDRRVNALPRTRRGARRDVTAPRDLRGCHCHHGRRDMRVSTTWCVTACGLTWDRLLPRDQTRSDFIFKILDRLFLRLGEAAHIVMCIANIVFQLRGHLLGGRLDLIPGQHDIAIVLVKLRCVLQRLGIATGLDLVRIACTVSRTSPRRPSRYGRLSSDIQAYQFPSR